MNKTKFRVYILTMRRQEVLMEECDTMGDATRVARELIGTGHKLVEVRIYEQDTLASDSRPEEPLSKSV